MHLPKSPLAAGRGRTGARTRTVSVSGFCCNQSKDQWGLDQGRGRWEMEEGRRSELFGGKVSWTLRVSGSED